MDNFYSKVSFSPCRTCKHRSQGLRSSSCWCWSTDQLLSWTAQWNLQKQSLVFTCNLIVNPCLSIKPQTHMTQNKSKKQSKTTKNQRQKYVQKYVRRCLQRLESLARDLAIFERNRLKLWRNISASLTCTHWRLAPWWMLIASSSWQNIQGFINETSWNILKHHETSWR